MWSNSVSGSVVGLCVAVSLFIERVDRHLKTRGRTSLAQVLRTILRNQARPLPPVKCPEVSKGAQRGLLHDVLGIFLIPHEPACQSIRGIEMRQDKRRQNSRRSRTPAPADTVGLFMEHFEDLLESLRQRRIPEAEADSA